MVQVVTIISHGAVEANSSNMRPENSCHRADLSHSIAIRPEILIFRHYRYTTTQMEVVVTLI